MEVSEMRRKFERYQKIMHVSIIVALVSAIGACVGFIGMLVTM